MPSPLRQVLSNIGERIDLDLLPALYSAASLTTEQIRMELAAADVRIAQPDVTPDLHELEAASAAVIRRATRRAAARGAIAGAGGLMAVPPEAALSAVQTVRLAQRLAVVWGHDIDTDLGQLTLARTLAAGFDVVLPDCGPIDLRLRDLPMVLTSKSSTIRNQTADVAGIIVVRSAVTLASRFSRWIPGVGAGLGAVTAHRSIRGQAERMVVYLRRLYTGGSAVPSVEDAVEVQNPR